MKLLFGFISGLLLVIGFLPYIKDIFRLKTKPERASWLIWSVLLGISFFSQLAEGAKWSLAYPAVDFFIVTIIFLLSIKFGVGGLARRDIISLVAAGFGLLLWFFTSNPLTALLLVIVIDGIGAYLTVVKTYEQPETETLFSWYMSVASGIFAALAIAEWDFAQYVFPLYIIAADGAVVLAIYAGRMAQQRLKK